MCVCAFVRSSMRACVWCLSVCVCGVYVSVYACGLWPLSEERDYRCLDLSFRVCSLKTESLCKGVCRFRLDSSKSELAEHAVQAGIVWQPIREKPSHVTRQEMLVHSRLNSLSQCGLIFGLKEWILSSLKKKNKKTKKKKKKKKKKRKREMICRTFPYNPRMRGRFNIQNPFQTQRRPSCGGQGQPYTEVSAELPLLPL